MVFFRKAKTHLSSWVSFIKLGVWFIDLIIVIHMESLGTRVTSVQSADPQTTRSPQARRGAAPVKHALSSGPFHPFRLWMTTVFDAHNVLVQRCGPKCPLTATDRRSSPRSQPPQKSSAHLSAVPRPHRRAHLGTLHIQPLPFLRHSANAEIPLALHGPRRQFHSKDLTDQQTNVFSSSDSVGFPPSPTKVHLFWATLPPTESKNFSHSESL